MARVALERQFAAGMLQNSLRKLEKAKSDAGKKREKIIENALDGKEKLKMEIGVPYVEQPGTDATNK
ncbi:MAG: hypothetical protein AAB112_04240, partial [Thermodesulfobacteriota bacterium]